MTKDLGLLFLVLSRVKSLKECFIRLHKTSDSNCGSYRIISVTLKRGMKTQISEKSNLPSENKLLTLFPRNIGYDKPQGTTYNDT